MKNQVQRDLVDGLQKILLSFLFVISFFSFSFAQSFQNPNVRLIVTVDGQEVKENDSINIQADKPLQMKVGIRRLSGKVDDVTSSPKTELYSATPWNLTVDKNGLIKARYKKMDIQENWSLYGGTLTVAYGNIGESEIGFRVVNFVVNVDEQFYAAREDKIIETPPTPTVDVPVPEDEPDTAELTPDQMLLQEYIDNTNKEPSPSENAEISEDPSSVQSSNSGKEEPQADFIDYESLKNQTQNPSVSPAVANPNLEMTDEERRLYNEVLNQP